MSSTERVGEGRKPICNCFENHPVEVHDGSWQSWEWTCPEHGHFTMTTSVNIPSLPRPTIQIYGYGVGR